MRTKSTIATTLVAALIALGLTTVTSAAKAETQGSIDWGRLLVDLNTVAHRGVDVLDSPRCALAGCQTDTNATAHAPERLAASRVQRADRSWLGVSPKVSLVARDWSSAFKVAGEGDRLALVDALRLTSSTRMVLGRVRLNDSRITPFVQVGLGEWRTDPYLLPRTARYSELAAQAGAGLEVRVMGTWQVALESTATMLYQEYREARDEGKPSVQIWSTTLASRVDF